MRRPRHDNQLSLPPTEVQSLHSGAAAVKNPHPPADLAQEPAERLASRLFDAALTRACISSNFVALHLGVSDSLVAQWRQEQSPKLPSFGQMLRLPFTFQLALHKEMNAHFGFGRAALADLLDAAGRVAVNL